MLSTLLAILLVSASAADRFVIAGYAPDYRLDALDLNQVGANATDIILFSIQATAESTIDAGAITTMHHMRASRAKKANPHLRILVSMGGAGRSAMLPKSIETAAGRARLAKALLKYCKRGKLDGVDIDWEANEWSPMPNFVDFLKRVRRLFDAEEKPLMLTMAIHTQHADDLAEAYEHVHRVHLMSYDSPHKDGHAAVRFATQSAQNVLNAGCPAEKLTLGVAFYGRKMDNTNTAMTFKDLRDMQQLALAKADGERFRDDRVAGYSFDSPSTCWLKVELAAALGLAGVMVWELGQDAHSTEHRGGVLLAELAAAAAVSSDEWSPGHKQDIRRVSAAHNAVSMFYMQAGEHDEL